MTARRYAVRAELQADALNSTIVAEVARELVFVDCSAALWQEGTVAIDATVAAANDSAAESYLVNRVIDAFEGLGVTELRLVAVRSALMLRQDSASAPRT